MSKCGEKNGNAKGDGVLPISISIDILLQEDEFDCLASLVMDRLNDFGFSAFGYLSNREMG